MAADAGSAGTCTTAAAATAIRTATSPRRTRLDRSVATRDPHGVGAVAVPVADQRSVTAADVPERAVGRPADEVVGQEEGAGADDADRVPAGAGPIADDDADRARPEGQPSGCDGPQ